MNPRRRRTALGAGALALPLAALLGPAAPALADDTGPVITSVATSNDAGGLTPYLPLACSVVVSFTDATRSPGAAYAVVVTDAAGARVLRAPGASYDRVAHQLVAVVPCHEVPEDVALTYRVLERDRSGAVTGRSRTQPHTTSYVGHPLSASDSSVMLDGEWSNVVGKRSRISFDGGWEAGTVLSTQVWTSPSKDFTAADRTANVDGSAALVSSGDAGAPALGFVPRPRDVDRWVWVSVRGDLPGKGSWAFWFAPERVVWPAQPASWVRSYGGLRGLVDSRPEVGHRLDVTAARLASAAESEGAVVRRQWLVAGAAVTGATAATFTPTRSMRGRSVAVRVTVHVPRHRDRTATLTAGRVRR